MSSPKLYDKRRLDVSQAFLVYVATVGDCARTALALDIDEAIVKQLAKDEGWDLKIQRVCLLSKSEKPGDFERAQHRAMCFVQAHRTGRLLDSVIRRCEEMTPDEMFDLIQVTDKLGRRHISARFLADLAASLEKVHALGYDALGDTITERTERRRSGQEDGMNASALHAAVISALNQADARGVPADVLVKRLSESVTEEAERTAIPTAPIDIAPSPQTPDPAPGAPDPQPVA